ncbi:MAG: bifunctional adenosylcobinamide kinase/adenosylcobinamide-phosphate guanylyltransferase [Nitrospirota bacterium]
MSASSAGRSVLIVGGARSGKSRFALELGRATPGRRAFVATCRVDPDDTDMVARVEAHRARRDGSWTTIEESLDLGERVERVSREYDVLVVDCLTLWLANLVTGGEPDTAIDRRLICLIEAIAAVPARVVLVTNEVGMGVVPATPLGRAFRDWQGLVNQAVAEVVDDVYAMTAGLAHRLKPMGVA